MARSHALSFRDVHKSFGRHTAIEGLSFDVPLGSFTSLMGSNGSGKSTLLLMAAGLLSANTGVVEGVCDESAQRCGVVFQDYESSLLPWRSVAANITLPLESGTTRLSQPERVRLSKKILEQLNISLPLDRYTYELSGGQKQMTCVARAMIASPELLLLDEPFSSLDIRNKLELTNRIDSYRRQRNATVLFISHEVDDALLAADRVVVLRGEPASEALVVDVDLPSPRSTEVLASPEYLATRIRLIEELIG